MLKQSYILLFYLVSICCFSQKDSSVVRWPNLNHFIGIDFGYSGYDKIVGYKGETNINYVFNPQYFMIKVQLGIAPSTNFGTLKKGFISIGFSTKSNKTISWHMLTGVGNVKPTKTYVLQQNNYKYENVFLSNFYVVETGFYIKPKKTKRLIIGVNTSFYSVSIFDYRDMQSELRNKIVLNNNISINFKLNK